MLDPNDLHEYNRNTLLHSKLFNKLVEDIIIESNNTALECIRVGKVDRATFLANMKTELATVITRLKSNYKKINEEKSNGQE